ncbi:hypothetical protein HanRHA438_Chr13g0612941 [Helianthus annuus]|uniref:Transposase (putative) gypsy type domain-containing protein n=1 Tax=Helianthus annuus TaxID=4232 RepID=A0A9K3HD41_HELAN|nr:hypothetical protein HanXRQr2_Chr13g0602681 [Helianthus annuus]KAJ0477940.1 hypothetical protein HanHA300_Chr13g0494571 [Helianthus annuus]KAJ0498770.1 hypothetical protein HanHA89_Chr13g0526691 [Helianthus annuus]KAJ0664790.1 hypothetical protein HanLR1_Chr13g0496761 [Helianthus annuus]KAJ0672230.1 hypothetical protein HanOQP8_Chr13g0494931 [Helianthus annuus]
MVTMFVDFFVTCNLRLPLTVFMVDSLEFYKIHTSQLSPLGMVRARHFEYCFRSKNSEPLVEGFRQFYQMHVQLGFYFFRWRDNAPKLMSSPPKGFTAWKSKFFYVKEDWAAALQAVPLMTLGNKELQYLRMMLRNKPGVKNKLVMKEQDKVRFWRTFADDFKGKIEVVECSEEEEGWYKATVAGFWLPNPTALDAPLRQGRGNVSMFGKLGALGDSSGKGSKTAPAVVVVPGKGKKTEKPVTIPVKQVVSGTFRPRIRKSEDFIMVSNTLEGLGVPGSSSGAGGATTGTRPTIGQKRKGDTAAAGGSKRAALRRPRAVVLNMCMHAVSVGKFLHTYKKFYMLNFPEVFVYYSSCKATYPHSYSTILSTESCG